MYACIAVVIAECGINISCILAQPALRIKSKGLVKYRYLTISKGIRLDSIRNAGYVRYRSNKRHCVAKAIVCKRYWHALLASPEFRR